MQNRLTVNRLMEKLWQISKSKHKKWRVMTWCLCLMHP